jgi:predicted component of type VI protein secretion system
MYERITEEGEVFDRLNREAKRQGRVKRKSAKRQKAESIDAKLAELLSDAEWLPLVGCLFLQNSCIHVL